VLDHLHRRPSPTLVPLPDNLLAESDDARETVDELLARLADADRQLVQLRLEGYRADEIAERMGCDATLSTSACTVSLNVYARRKDETRRDRQPD
jgi:DNA-directed RNA polymerase specialized sigma24 family protein